MAALNAIQQADEANLLERSYVVSNIAEMKMHGIVLLKSFRMNWEI